MGVQALDSVLHKLGVDPFGPYLRQRADMVTSIERAALALVQTQPSDIDFILSVIGTGLEFRHDTLPTRTHVQRIVTWLWWRRVRPESDSEPSRFRELAMRSLQVMLTRSPESDAPLSKGVAESWEREVAKACVSLGPLGEDLARCYFLEVLRDGTRGCRSVSELCSPPTSWEALGRTQVWRLLTACRLAHNWHLNCVHHDPVRITMLGQWYAYCMVLLRLTPHEAPFVPWAEVTQDKWIHHYLGWLLPMDVDWDALGSPTPPFVQDGPTTPLSDTALARYKLIHEKQRAADWADRRMTWCNLRLKPLDPHHIMPSLLSNSGVLVGDVLLHQAINSRSRLDWAEELKAFAQEPVDDDPTPHELILMGLGSGDCGRRVWLDHLLVCGPNWADSPAPEAADMVRYMSLYHSVIGEEVTRLCEKPAAERVAAVRHLQLVTMEGWRVALTVLETACYQLGDTSADSWQEHCDMCWSWIEYTRDLLKPLMLRGPTALRQPTIKGLNIWNRPVLMYELVEELFARAGDKVPITWLPDIAGSVTSPELKRRVSEM